MMLKCSAGANVSCSRRPFSSSTTPPVISRLVVCKAGGAGGFGKSNKKKVSTEGGMVIPEDGKRVKKSYLADSDSKAASKAAADGAPPGFPNDWIDLKLKASDVPFGKNTKTVELAAGKVLMLYKFENMVFVSDANSTAYQYPMVDAKVFRDSSGAIAAEVPLDGTIYDLATGAVLKWCPKDTRVRSLLGTLKSTVQATPLQVYPVHVTQDGSIWTKLVL
ncbi:hypothetical protein OEZ86_000708 [Tetradesmus obliquus]|nr:hypothetical protein OEZ86_000708 [Tetradesmus obliquus]